MAEASYFMSATKLKVSTAMMHSDQPIILELRVILLKLENFYWYSLYALFQRSAVNVLALRERLLHDMIQGFEAKS